MLTGVVEDVLIDSDPILFNQQNNCGAAELKEALFLSARYLRMIVMVDDCNFSIDWLDE